MSCQYWLLSYGLWKIIRVFTFASITLVDMRKQNWFHRCLFPVQMFHLMPVGPGNFYVQNDMFRLNYG
jgi:hypothetical protein